MNQININKHKLKIRQELSDILSKHRIFIDEQEIIKNSDTLLVLINQNGHSSFIMSQSQVIRDYGGEFDINLNKWVIVI